MFALHPYLAGLAVALALATAVWILSVVRRNAGIVDSAWSLMFLAATVSYAVTLAQPGPRAVLVLALVGIWAIRLAGYITWRNWGEPEDRRYQAIRTRNEPNFALKSLYLVFWLQALLAWLISLPLLAAVAGTRPVGILDYTGVLVWLIGFVFEAGGDFQLARFKANPDNRGKVMDKGLWRYTRHPNYFGDFLIWWGFFLLALSAGGWWSIFAPILMSVLLLRVSGITLLEKDITERRPAYRDYIARTNAFIPGPQRARTLETGETTS